MSEAGTGGGVLPAQLRGLAELRATGVAAGGRVTAEVDGTGDLVRLSIDPQAMRMPSADLAEEVRRAFQAARAGVRERLEEARAGAGPVPTGIDPQVMRVAMDAQRRLDELASITRHLADRLSPPS